MDDVRGDFSGPPHGTTPAAVIGNKTKTEILFFFAGYQLVQDAFSNCYQKIL